MTATLLMAFVDDFGWHIPARPKGGGADRRTGSRWLQAAAALRRFLLYVYAESLGGDPLAKEAVEKLSHSRPLGQEALQQLAFRFIDWTSASTEQRDGLRTASSRTRGNTVSHLFSAFRIVEPTGIIPSLGRNQKRLSHFHVRDRIKSLGEQVSSLDPSIASDPSLSVVMRHNRERLRYLRSRFVTIFEEGWADFEDGRRLLHRSDLPPVEEIAAAVASLPRNYGLPTFSVKDHPEIAACFPEDDPEKRSASLLKYLKEVRLGFFFSEDRTAWWRLIQNCGGRSFLLRRLGPDVQTLISAYGVVLIDTGFNAQPCDDLRADPIVLRAKSGRQTLSTVTSFKMRAGGKLVQAVLRDYEQSVLLKSSDWSTSSVSVIERWTIMSELYRHRARLQADGTENYLWVHPSSGNEGAKIAVAPSMTSRWRSLVDQLAEEPGLAGLNITRQSVRRTVIQLAINDGALDVAAAALVGNHAAHSTTVQNYLSASWFRSELDEQIRIFQRRLENGLLSERAGRALNVSPADLAQAREQAEETGLGFACANRNHKSAPRSSEGSLCAQLENCATCSLMRFVPSPEAIDALVHTRASLEAAAQAFQAQNPSRWAEVWLPTLALTLAAIGRLSESHHRAALKRAEVRLADDMSNGARPLFHPW